MATTKQLRHIFSPILAEYPDLVLQGRWLFRPPIKTAIVGLYVDRTSSANNSAMWLSVVPLSRFNSPWVHGFKKSFEVERVIGAPPDKWIGAPPDKWVVGGKNEPPRIYQDMFAPEYSSHLLRNFSAKAVPFLDKVRTFRDVVAWIRQFREPPLRNSAIELIDGWLAAMQGDFAAAADHLSSYLQGKEIYSRQNPANDNQRLQEDILRVLRTGDKIAIAAFLHQVEQQPIVKFRLERFWQRTPFPFERG